MKIGEVCSGPIELCAIGNFHALISYHLVAAEWVDESDFVCVTWHHCCLLLPDLSFSRAAIAYPSKITIRSMITLRSES